MASKTNEVVLELIRIISQPPFKRENQQIENVLPWLTKRSQLLQNQSKSVLLDIVKNCTFLSVQEDDVIIKQGERGDSFYVILRGSAAIYIDPRMTGEGTASEDALSRTSAKKKRRKKPPQIPESEASVLSGMEKPSEEDPSENTEATKTEDGHEEEDDEGEDGEGPTRKKPIQLLTPMDRNKYGKFIADYGVGSTFGEVALVNKDTFRNASIIANESTDLIVIDQDLFDRSLRAEQEARYAEIRDFIDDHPFFKDMNTKFKKLLEMSLRKERYIFDTNIIRQGDPVTGLHFIISGSANISIQPKKHVSQYTHLWPFEAGMDQIAIEFEHLREARRAAILRKYEDPSVWETKPEELVIRREQGYAAIEKKMKENHISLCSVQNKEVLGDVEMLVNIEMDRSGNKNVDDVKVDDVKHMLYDVEDTPPWYLCLLLGFQNCLLVFGSSIPVPLLLSEWFCMSEDKVAVSELLGTTFFVTGLCTLIQTTLGVRLPLVQGCSASFLTQAITLMRSTKCPDVDSIPDDNMTSNVTSNMTSSPILHTGSEAYRETWTSRIREVQGSIIVASVLEIMVGCTGTLGFILRFVGPLTITPTLTLIGLSLFRSGTNMASGQWWIAITTVMLFTISSQYLRNVEVPVPGLSKLSLSRRLPLFSLFPILIGIFGTWAICAILTATSLLPEHPEKWGYIARTDIGIDVLKDASWFRVPYPGQWGIPTISAAGVFSMLIAVIVTMIDAVGNVYACATIAEAPPLPGNVVNRGIFMQGVCCMLAGLWGTGNGTTTASDSMSIIGITKVASLRVIQTCGVMLMIFGCFGKFGALFTTIPTPIIGGMLMAIFGIISGVGLSFLQFIDLNSFRNMFILGISLFFGISMPNWLMENQEAIQTGSDFLDQVLNILLSTSMFVGAVVGFVLDNTIPGTDSERGLTAWKEHKLAGTMDLRTMKRLKIYELPLINKYFHNSRIAKHIPFCFMSLWPIDKVAKTCDISCESVNLEIMVSKETVYSITESVKL